MIRVVTDSSCDLPPEVLKELEIVVVPLVVRIGREEFLETDLGIDEFWTKVGAARAQGLFPQTSQPSLGAFESMFASLVGDGNEVVCVTITSKHSGTFNTAWAAAQRFGKAVSIVDSWSTSLGLGFLAMAAARSVRKGASLNEVLALLRGMRGRTHLLAVLDTIEYIRMGGRANALIPILSRLVRFLQIKPIIGFVEGELRLLGQARTFPAALAKVEQHMKELQPFAHLGVLHTRRPHDAQVVADQLRQSMGFQGQILVGETGAVLSSHAGPGVVAVVGMEEG
ncbi:MAG: DegV family EDD domain-containing protein [Anaerolineae bacterium]|nr:DegV family EDD domain-containing protein [Anaerolineae bacterium]